MQDLLGEEGTSGGLKTAGIIPIGGKPLRRLS